LVSSFFKKRHDLQNPIPENQLRKLLNKKKKILMV